MTVCRDGAKLASIRFRKMLALIDCRGQLLQPAWGFRRRDGNCFFARALLAQEALRSRAKSPDGQVDLHHSLLVRLQTH